MSHLSRITLKLKIVDTFFFGDQSKVKTEKLNKRMVKYVVKFLILIGGKYMP